MKMKKKANIPQNFLLLVGMKHTYCVMYYIGIIFVIKDEREERWMISKLTGDYFTLRNLINIGVTFHI